MQACALYPCTYIAECIFCLSEYIYTSYIYIFSYIGSVHLLAGVLHVHFSCGSQRFHAGVIIFM